VTAEKKTKTLKSREQALKHLDLPSYFEPCAKIAHILGRLGLNLEQAISYLRTSEVESAMLVVAMYDRVPNTLRYRIDLDDVIAGARVDMHKIFSLIAESYSKINALETSMIAAGKSPVIMERRAHYAQQADGHQDARMILQATGNAPVPVNQRITNNLIGNKIDNSKTLNIGGIPSLEQVVNAAEKPLTLDYTPEASKNSEAQPEPAKR